MTEEAFDPSRFGSSLSHAELVVWLSPALRVSNLHIALSQNMSDEAFSSGSTIWAHFADSHPKIGIIQAYFQRKRGVFKWP